MDFRQNGWEFGLVKHNPESSQFPRSGAFWISEANRLHASYDRVIAATLDVFCPRMTGMITSEPTVIVVGVTVVYSVLGAPFWCLSYF